MSSTKHRNILLKMSGEALMGNKKFGHDYETLKNIAIDIASIHKKGIKISIVVGGGNIYRGEDASALGMERSTADYMGMLGTVINALALQNALEDQKINTRVLSAIPMTTICEPYIRRRAKRHLEKNRIVIFAAGTGNPYFTTDTAAVLKAVEMNCDTLFKATQVDGVYSADPRKNEEAVRYSEVSYDEMLQKKLKVMDMAAIALARENKLPIKVFSIKEKSSFEKVINGQGKYTYVKGE